MITQVEIARICKLDVSSVNKILNGAEGPVFRKETKRRVRQVARELGYQFNRPNKLGLMRTIRSLIAHCLAGPQCPVCKQAKLMLGNKGLPEVTK